MSSMTFGEISMILVSQCLIIIPKNPKCFLYNWTCLNTHVYPIFFLPGKGPWRWPYCHQHKDFEQSCTRSNLVINSRVFLGIFAEKKSQQFTVKTRYMHCASADTRFLCANCNHKFLSDGWSGGCFSSPVWDWMPSTGCKPPTQGSFLMSSTLDKEKQQHAHIFASFIYTCVLTF